VESTLVTDPLLATLPEVFDPATIGAHLGRLVPVDWGAIQDIRFQILKHHPGSRCTIEIALRTETGEYSLIGKVYASDRSDVYRVMEAIQRSGFGPEHEFSIPQPLAYDPGLRLLLQEKVDGPRAKPIFVNAAAADRAEASARAAGWLARFHTVAPLSGRFAPLTRQLDDVNRWSRRIARLGEPFASQAQRLAQRLADEAASTRNARVCAGHGSYSCHQIILGDARTVTFDWDSYDVADPCRDVARFVVALQRLAVKYLGGIRALDAATEVFLRTYQARSPYDVAANLAWYRALTCLRLAKYEANRPVCTLPEGIEALLDEGLRVLEEKTP
jgi:aminoglycoside phosphotransferase (APT) family kinase protein